MIVIKNKYDNKKIIDFIEWLSKYLNISVTYKEIKEIPAMTIFSLLSSLGGSLGMF